MTAQTDILAIRPTAARIISRIAQAPLPSGVSESQRDFTLQNLQALAVKPEDAGRIVPKFLQSDWGPEANGIGAELQNLGIGNGGSVVTGASVGDGDKPLWPARLQMIVQTILSGLQQTSQDSTAESAWLQQELGILIATPTVPSLRLTIAHLLEPGAGPQAQRLAAHLRKMLAQAAT
jgi:hypothetical protein